MEILEAYELRGDKHYWIYPKSLVVIPQDQHRMCKVHEAHGTTYVQLEGSDFGEPVEYYEDCMFIEIPRLDISVWAQHAEEKQFPELLRARGEAKDDEE